MLKNKELILAAETSFWEKLVSWGTLVIFVITPLLYSSNRIASAVTSKQYFFIGAVDILLIALTWLMVSDSNYRFNKKMWVAMIPVGLFTLSAVISTLFGSDFYTSLYSTIERGGGLILVLHALMFAVVVALVTKVQGYSFVKKNRTSYFGICRSSGSYDLFYQ
jgi:hypothetical protein